MSAVKSDAEQTEDWALDISLFEGPDEISTLLGETDNGCSSSCPDACTGSGVTALVCVTD